MPDHTASITVNFSHLFFYFQMWYFHFTPCCILRIFILNQSFAISKTISTYLKLSPTRSNFTLIICASHWAAVRVTHGCLDQLQKGPMRFRSACEQLHNSGIAIPAPQPHSTQRSRHFHDTFLNRQSAQFRAHKSRLGAPVYPRPMRWKPHLSATSRDIRAGSMLATNRPLATMATTHPLTAFPCGGGVTLKPCIRAS